MIVISLYLATIVLTCAAPTVAPPAFNGDRSYGYLTQQVAFGPRVPGTEPWKNCRAYLVKHFVALGSIVDSQAFTFHDPYSGADTPMVNIMVRFKGHDQEALPILLAAHWDSRPRTDFPTIDSLRNKAIPGANDGASGVAVLMELANLFAAQSPACDVELVLVDGEDWGKEGDFDNYLLGAKKFAQAEIRNKFRFGIVLDMIGDRDQQIYREGYSNQYDRNLNDMVWKAARALGIATFVDSVKYTVIDDHLPLSAAGVPTIDLIDFDYPWWHSDEDTPDKCSPQSLANVGKVLAEIVYKKALWPKR